MASASNTSQPLLKQTSTNSDPYPKLYPSDLPDPICSQSIPSQSSSSVQTSSPNNCPPTEPLAPKHLFIELLDEELKKLLKKKLIYAIKNGKPFETIQQHREQLVQQLIRWILPTVEIPDEYNSFYKEQLLTLLSSVKITQDVPADNTSWVKLLTQWIKKNNEADREVYKIMAVDGFHGFQLKDLQNYLLYVLCKLRREYELHVIGVRAMYDFFDENYKIESLMGIDSACIVFLALLDLYSSRLNLVDDQVLILVRAAMLKAEGFLQQRSEQFPDIKCVDTQLRKSFGNIYLQQFECKPGMEESWKQVAIDLLKHIHEK